MLILLLEAEMSEDEYTLDDLCEALEGVSGGGPFVPWTDYLYMKEKYEKLVAELRKHALLDRNQIEHLIKEQ